MELDVRIRDSGICWGNRNLTTKGDSKLSRLVFNVAMQGRRNALCEPYYEAVRSRGPSTTAVFVALGRKPARVCFFFAAPTSQVLPGMARQGARRNIGPLRESSALSGKYSEMVVPLPGALSACTRPRERSMNLCTMLKPRPLPA
jgi:hypothetical protein